MRKASFGCTEICLLVTAADLPGTVLYDTTALHVDRAARLSLGLEPLPAESVPAARGLVPVGRVLGVARVIPARHVRRRARRTG